MHAVLTTTMTSHSTSLHLLQFLLKLLDLSMGSLKVLVQSVSLTNQLLLPSSESLLLNLDLLGESLSQRLFLFLELGVVQFSWSGFSKLPRLHLLCTVGFVVVLFGGVNEIEHMGADEDGAELLKVAVILVFHFSHTPCVLAALDDAAVGGLDIFLAANDAEGHGSHQGAGVLGSGFVVFFDGRLVDLDALGFDDIADAVLKAGKVGGRESVGFGNDGDEIDTSAETLHDFNVERLEGVAGGADEVEAGMDSEVNLVCAAGLLLLKHV